MTINKNVMKSAHNMIRHLKPDEIPRFLRGMAAVDHESATSKELKRLSLLAEQGENVEKFLENY